MPYKAHLLWADILRVLSIIAVVMIHSSAPLLLLTNDDQRTLWWIGNVYDSLSRWCIPVFFMLSGAFLIEELPKVSLKFFFLKRIKKIVIPFLFWSAFYYSYRIYFNKEQLVWRDFFTNLLTEPIHYHLWFIYILIELYLLSPILALFAYNAQLKHQLYFIYLWIITGCVLPIIQAYFNFSNHYFHVSLSSLWNYTGYFVLGFFIQKNILQVKNKKYGIFVFMFILGALSTVYGTFIVTFYKNQSTFNDLFYHYYSINVVAMAVSVFLLISATMIRTRAPRESPGLLQAVAGCVPGIYFLHPFVLSIIKRGITGFHWNETTVFPLIGVPVLASGITLISFICIYILRKIPILKLIVN